MKIISVLMTLIIIHLSANEKWIKIESIKMTHKEASKEDTTIDVNLSQVEPVNKMITNMNLIRQVIKATDKKEVKIIQNHNDKNWFVINKGTQ